jgi:ATPase subunit of ABC transporter with duplicated ATPase domains
MSTTAPINAIVTASGLSFSWPDGQNVLESISFAAPAGPSGLVGDNGCGKSTLLRLLAGLEVPTAGTLRITGRAAFVPQDVTIDPGQRVEDVLGVAERRAALRRIEAGEVAESLFETVGQDWDIDQRTMSALASLGLGDLDLDRAVGELSGGQARMLAFAAAILDRPDVLALDEPTNDLDADARSRVGALVAGWRRGALIVASHDRELLEGVDRIGELRAGTLTWYGGGWTAYREAVDAEQAAAHAALRQARAERGREDRERREAEAKIAARRRAGAKAQAEARYPKIVANTRKRDAQVSAGKLRAVHADRLAQARDRVAEAEARIRPDGTIRVSLPGTAVPAGRDVVELRDAVLPYGAAGGQGVDLLIRGPERLGLVGANAAGKTTLANVIVGTLAPVRGTARTAVPARILPQRLDILDPTMPVLAAVSLAPPGEAGAGGPTGQEVRAALARFGLRGSDVDRPVESLSGGELLRATLASVLLARPTPQLLVLDEPTNSLDVATVEALVSALDCYLGALIVASHDTVFLRGCRLTRWLDVGPSGVVEVEGAG